MDDDRDPIEIHDGSKWADDGQGIGGPTICTVNADGSCSPMIVVFPLKPAKESKAFAEMLVHRANNFPAMLAALKSLQVEVGPTGLHLTRRPAHDALIKELFDVIADAEKP